MSKKPELSLSDIRKTCGRTQLHMAQRMNRSRSDIRQIEEVGDQYLKICTIREYARIFGMKLRVSFELPNGTFIDLKLRSPE